jgi:hypothetical protein
MSEKIPQSYVFDEDVFNEYRERVRALGSSIEDDQLDEYLMDIYNFDQMLQKKYGNETKKRAFWHALVGSTPRSFDDFVADDFEGDDSIERFLGHLEEKYSNK